MGGMTVSVFVRADDQMAVVEAARAVLGPAYGGRAPARPAWAVRTGANLPDLPAFLVSPALGGWVGVHDAIMQGQSEQLCEQVAVQLSARLQTAAITFLVHDGDFLVYWLAHRGELVDAYHSMPHYFDGDFDEDEAGGGSPEGGNPQLLAEVCGRPGEAEALAAVLTAPDDDGYERLAKLGAVLGIPDPTTDYDLLTYVRPVVDGKPVGYEPKVPHREEYLSITP